MLQKSEFSRRARIEEQVDTCSQTTDAEWEPHDNWCMQKFLFEDHGGNGDRASWACLGASWQASVLNQPTLAQNVDEEMVGHLFSSVQERCWCK